MSKSIFDKEWIDLVFEGRNKSYGAYKLRQQDPKTTIIALFSGIALVGALIGVPVAINYFNPVPQTAEVNPPLIPETQIFELQKFKDKTAEKPKIEKPEVRHPDPATPQPTTPTVAPTVPTVRFVQPVISSTQPPEDLPTIDDLKNTNPGGSDNPGDEHGNFPGLTKPGDGNSNGVSGDGNDEGTTSNFNVDVQPGFPGGIQQFYKRVSREFRTPDTERELTLKVYVSFVVEKDGSLSNIKVLRDPGHGLGDEAIRVLKSIKTKWSPGIKDGKPVRTAYNLPITVNVK